MRRLTRTEIGIMAAGGGLMVCAACVVMLTTLVEPSSWTQAVQWVQPWAFLLGAVMYVVMQQRERYTGGSMVIRRLKGIQLLSGISLIVAGLLMVENFYHFVQPFFVHDIDSYYTYLRVVHNNWVVAVLIGAMLQMYTSHRLSSELDKES